ncbi:MAG: type 1 glutamine amidotransferase [Actinomycetaceae bacterium]|nr:type 1 glutamine amidotransferase [Actinomycetaceae bacterium]
MNTVYSPPLTGPTFQRAQHVTFIQHEPRVHGGQLRIDIEALGSSVDVVKAWTTPHGFFDSFEVAGPVVVLGGTFNAYADDIAPWLPSLRRWLARAIPAYRTVFGVCLGHQLIAASLGGRVSVDDPRGPEKSITRIRWKSDDPFVKAIGSAPIAFADHADAVVDVPTDARILAHSDRYIQAMRIKNAVSVQFHPEINADVIEEWYRDDEPGNLPTYRRDFETHEKQLRDLSRRVATWIVSRG